MSEDQSNAVRTKQDRLQSLMLKNQTLEDQAEALGVKFSPGMVYGLRLNMLLERLLTEDQRLDYEIAFQEAITPMLEQAREAGMEEQAKRQAGGNGGGLIIPQAQMPRNIRSEGE